jgi:phosphate transport system permease protein
MPRRQTRWTVRFLDRLANGIITVGGLFVILAVVGMLVFLAAVVVPLFLGARAGAPVRLDLPPAATPVLFTDLDEYQSLVLDVHADGTLRLFETEKGGPVSPQSPSLGLPAAITAFARPLVGGGVCFGLADGSVVSGKIFFEPQFLAEDDPDVKGLADLKPGQRRAQGGGVVERTLDGSLRRIRPRIDLAPPVSLAPGDPIVALDCRMQEASDAEAVLTASGKLQITRVTSTTNMLTGEVTRTPVSTAVPWEGASAPRFLLLTSVADQLYVAWTDGMLWRYDLSNPQAPALAEKVDLVPEPGGELRALAFPIGEQSILAADSLGRVSALFRLPLADDPPDRLDAGGSDGFVLCRAHKLEPQPAGVRLMAVSARDKSFATAADDGSVWLRHLTSEQTLLKLSLSPAGPPRALRISPKNDGLLVIPEHGAALLWPVSIPHPETTLRALAGKVWYEGYSKPGYTWQSSSGTDDFEPKLSLVPLAFGTFKATLFAMLFAVPLALGAAIYTSEFLHRDLRIRIKPVIEMMASLPSVVLGFIAAIILAPFVETWVLPVLLGFLLAPVLFLAGGMLVQLLPHPWPRRLRGGVQLVILLGLPTLGWLLAVRLAPVLEAVVFGGEFKAWLSGRVGSGAALQGLLAWPLCAVLVAWLYGAGLRPRLMARYDGHSGSLAFLDTAAALFGLGLSLLLAGGGGWLSARAGLDLRPLLVGTYVQRNTLIVAFSMGFAVIPLIYSIAEDALSSVPDDLRSASLGCGATRWQTAVRVVLPMATSGVFAAIMIGLGRAVGETMIVLMAAGNTPVLDVNPFSGLRALSANIAVELPEAVQGSTLYRVLFLAALVLFVMTFIVNTAAELVRLRFRKRVAQL